MNFLKFKNVAGFLRETELTPGEALALIESEIEKLKNKSGEI